LFWALADVTVNVAHNNARPRNECSRGFRVLGFIFVDVAASNYRSCEPYRTPGYANQAHEVPFLDGMEPKNRVAVFVRTEALMWGQPPPAVQRSEAPRLFARQPIESFHERHRTLPRKLRRLRSGFAREHCIDPVALLRGYQCATVQGFSLFEVGPVER